MYSALANVEEQKKDWDEALHTMERLKLVRQDYATHRYFSKLAHIYAMKGDYPKAAELSRKSEELAGKNASYWLDGLINICLNDKARVRKDAEKMLSTYKEDPARYDQLILYIFLRYLDENTKAQEMISETAARLESDDWPAPLIRLAAKQIPEDEFLEKYENAAHVDQTEVHAYVGFFNYFDGNKEKARKQLSWVKAHGRMAYIEPILAFAIMRKEHWE